MQYAARELYHASMTGDFPRPGGLRDQPGSLRLVYGHLVDTLALRDRIGAQITTKGHGGSQKLPEVLPGDKNWQAAQNLRGLDFWAALDRLNAAKDTGTESEFWRWFMEGVDLGD